MNARERVAAIVAGVVRQAVADACANGVVVLDDGAPEARLALEWCAAAVGGARVVAARGERVPKEITALAARGANLAAVPAAVAEEEARRLEARLLAAANRLLPASAWNKTALLLSPVLPPEPLLPLGDLYASQLLALTGGWSAPTGVRDLAELSGGVDRLDAALRGYLEERRTREDAMSVLPAEASDAVWGALEAGRFGRRRVGLVPKLGSRTLGIDLLA